MESLTEVKKEVKDFFFYLGMGKVPFHLIFKNYYLLSGSYCEALIGSL